ncbi:hypothetical protein F511_46815 [Dorcoceras hygrometricum]|uniref:Uncharacterized protein n=1 Tax=Dorcoceras hygrometricum TaxID=472368 RepID=A0A2Z6ZZW9_9LAMI|nr:hypothetical protein F511_46815 [Dorcoceras hygrometricum]
MGFPGQARTKPRSKIQPSQQSNGDRRRTAAAATMLRAALGRTLAASCAAHGAGCANQWRNVSLLAGHLKRTIMREGAATSCTTVREPVAILAGDCAASARCRGRSSGRDARRARIQSRAHMRVHRRVDAAAHGGSRRHAKIV